MTFVSNGTKGGDPGGEIYQGSVELRREIVKDDSTMEKGGLEEGVSQRSTSSAKGLRVRDPGLLSLRLGR